MIFAFGYCRGDNFVVLEELNANLELKKAIATYTSASVMSLFANLFRGAAATSSTLFSDANIYNQGRPVQQPQQAGAPP